MTQLKVGTGEALASTAHNSAAQYSISVSCNRCAGMHETGISITIENGPSHRQSIGDFYDGKSLPKTLSTIASDSFSCPLTGRQFIQKDTKRIFLVPSKGRPTIENDARKTRKGYGLG
jgi:hypothetical protein